MFQFADGGETNLLWSNNEGYTASTPILAIMPGLTGCKNDVNMTTFVKAVNLCKYRLESFNFLLSLKMCYY